MCIDFPVVFESAPLCVNFHRTVRKEYIYAKYVDHKFARKTCSSAAAKMNDLFEAVRSRDLLALIQVYAEGVELMEPLTDSIQVSATLTGGQGYPFQFSIRGINVTESCICWGKIQLWLQLFY